ncbi:hypothetical protein ACFU7Y_23745 [Kitasatospora sp. NPDC057542]|uniref:hypothetical protein n=1 Tax=Streptomycetaceae TaxID=2062 RepID=UPI001CC9F19F|nr:hypothetical protein [Streptomyces sp. LS1784]
MSDRIATVWRYARVHHAYGLAVGLALVTACDALFGSINISIPAGNAAGVAVVPFRRELPIAFAALAAGSLHSVMADMERAASKTFRTYEVTHVVVVSAVTVVLLGSAEAIFTTTELAVVMMRALLIWLGLALLSGRIFGWMLSWILPVLTIFPLTYYGAGDLGRHRWWDWTGQSSASLPCWLLAVVSMAIGAVALGLTPWRMRGRRSTTGRPSRM